MRAARSALVVACALACSIAHANPADDAFKKGRELRKAQKWAEACAAFEESQRLDPQLGTQFNIAECDAKLGKLATALALYKEIAHRDSNATRKAAAADLAQKLEARVPKLQLQVTPRAPGLAVTINKKPASDPFAAQPVDFGTYDVVASAPGHDDASASVTVSDEAKVVVIALKLVPRAQPQSAARPAPSPRPAPVDRPPRSRRKTYATVAFGAGGIGVLGSIVFGLSARSAWNDAKDICGGSTECPDPGSAALANEQADTARSRGNTATLFLVVGALATTTGVVLWVTAPKERAVAVTAHPGGLSLVGRF